MSHIEHNASGDQTVDYPIPPNYDPLRGALVDIIALSKGTFPTNARRLGDIHNRARAALGELPITILAQPTPALDVERLRTAMSDADSQCSWFPRGCCGPLTHASAEDVAARYDVLSAPFYCVACGDLLPREAAYCAEHAHLGGPA